MLDFGEPTVRAVTYAAAAPFSDDPERASLSVLTASPIQNALTQGDAVHE